MSFIVIIMYHIWLTDNLGEVVPRSLQDTRRCFQISVHKHGSHQLRAREISEPRPSCRHGDGPIATDDLTLSAAGLFWLEQILIRISLTQLLEQRSTQRSKVNWYFVDKRRAVGKFIYYKGCVKIIQYLPVFKMFKMFSSFSVTYLLPNL